MRYRTNLTTSERCGQVMTPAKLAERLVSSLGMHLGVSLELGTGTGRLMQACVDSGSLEQYVGVEYDHVLAAQCQADPRAALFHANALDPQALQAVLGTRWFTTVLGNPPFGVEQLPAAAIERLRSLYPDVQVTNGWARLDLYFMLESLSRLRRPGQAAFIVAAPIAQDTALASFRRTLIESATEVECYELPHQTFDGRAEVQSFLLIARFGMRRGAKVTLGRLDGPDFSVSHSRTVDAQSATRRLDLAHHEFTDFNNAIARRRGFTTMERLGADICRGSRSRLQFSSMGVTHFHTSDFPQAGGDVSFDRSTCRGFQVASRGDILVARVGSRCIERTAFVAKGTRPFTEAVYRITLPAKARTAAFDWISSAEGQAWRRQASGGSCAKHLTVSALMSMPVPG